MVIAFGTYEASQIHFENEYLKFGVVVIAFVVDGVGVHVVTNAVRNRLEVGERFIISNSFGFHSCNADPKHCFRISGKPLPICARHLGLYGILTILLISALFVPNSWYSLAKSMTWNISLGIFIILLVAVVIEGGLGKARIIKQRRLPKFIGGICTGLGWVFFAMFFGLFFNLF